MNRNSAIKTYKELNISELSSFYSVKNNASTKDNILAKSNKKISRDNSNNSWTIVYFSGHGTNEIEKYFLYKPSIRAKNRSEYIKYIKSIEDILNILEFGNSKEKFYDAYDGAVDLLAECDGDILLEAFDFAQKNYVSTTTNEVSKSWEKNWDILIQALSCSINIEAYQKLIRILSLYNQNNKLSRLIKLALIDASIDLEIDEDDQDFFLLQSILQRFTSEKYEPEEFIRQCAKEAIKSL